MRRSPQQDSQIRIDPLQLPGSPPTPSSVFDSQQRYRIKNFSPPSLAIDVINDPATIASDAQLHLVPDSNLSGQFWQVRPSQTNPGSYNLCTLFLGTKMCLDVYGDDKKRPHLAPAGNYSGQQWLISSRGDGTWSLTNSYSGPELLLDVGIVNGDRTAALCLSDNVEASVSQRWAWVGLGKITQDGFGV